MTLFERIINWNEERGLLVEPIPNKEASFIAEELSEFLRANEEEDRIDAMADIIVFAVGYIAKLGLSPELVLNECLKHIESRKGYFDEDEGKFIKTTPKEDMYQPMYWECYI
jgi:hypothetical protein